MCILVIIYKVLDHFPVILFHSRDEDYDRGATEPHFVEENILCGQDIRAKGTWCGINITGHTVFLTNIRRCEAEDETNPELISRGTLVMEHLKGLEPQQKERYGMHNIIKTNLFEEADSVVYDSTFSNTSVLEQGVHVVSNSEMDDMTWPKVKWLKQKVEELVKTFPTDYKPEGKVEDCELMVKLGQLMTTTQRIPYEKVDESLTEKERILRGSVCFDLGDYGTRSQTVAMRAGDEVHYMFRGIQKCKPGPWKTWSFPAKKLIKKF